MEQLRKAVDVSRDFLGYLEEADKNELYRIGKRRAFAKNDFIFKAGEEDLNVWVVIRGRVKLFGSSAQGRDVLLWFTLAGEIFGLAECLQEGPRQIHARAAEKCETLSVAHTEFKEWLSLRPDVAYYLMKIMAMRMRELGQRFLSLANGSVQMEIAQLLLRLSASYGKLAGQHIHVSIPLTVQDIADMAGASRQGVSTCLAEMKRQGIIDSVRHFMIIKKLDYLQQIANGQSETVPRRHMQINTAGKMERPKRDRYDIAQTVLGKKEQRPERNS